MVRSSKILPLSRIVERFVKNGDALGFAGSSGRISIAFAYEVIRQRRKNLKFVSAGTGAPCLDLLVGAKAASSAEVSFTMVSNSNIKRALEGSQGSYRFKMEDYSNLAMSLRFFAGATRIPFIPIRSLRGSDIENVRSFLGKEKMALVKSPFKDHMETAVLPPSNPDVSIMHAQCADEDCNVLALGPSGPDGWLMRAGKKRVVTVERIMPRSFIRKNKLRVFLPGFMVDAICQIPYGAHPYGLVDCYSGDVSFQKEISTRSKTQRGFDSWAEEWVFKVRGRNEYLKKLGRERIAKITTGFLKNNRFT